MVSVAYVMSVCHRTHRVCAPLAAAGGTKFGKDPKKMEPALVKFGGGVLKLVVLFGGGARKPAGAFL